MPSPDEASTSSSSDPAPTFESLGLIDPLLEAVKQMNFNTPMDIQLQSLPHARQGRDIIGVASTSSGKTAAFALPILQKLWEDPKGLFACVLSPARELAYQISQQFEGLGSSMGVRCATIVGGMDTMAQSVALAKRPHIVVATPGRLNDHLENTKGFSLRGLKFLTLDFGPIIDNILKVIPRERTTYLFCATMTTKVAKLQRASLSNSVHIEVSEKYSTVSTLLQYYLFIPLVQKDVHFIYLANILAQNSIIIFTRTVHDAQRLSIVLRTLRFPAVPLHGQLSQSARLGALAKLKTSTLTHVPHYRGLDIPHDARGGGAECISSVSAGHSNGRISSLAHEVYKLTHLDEPAVAIARAHTHIHDLHAELVLPVAEVEPTHQLPLRGPASGRRRSTYTCAERHAGAMDHS
ncbi:P-loop containing nucleoside triphosphate hydrolase protein [Laetiporus sulphureus 93-53]|uniref:p-loop containing nucleoside triphosphate hydrolase protein n=1 Tax=Laetiporus sulphureus 93-53 TaxID=1314785 RepID=A0A165C3Z7_9APHY|nr:P-loop containing nucleoside triphosphate hydrolase protein [Laetiporus sulphureus 93-53]KZT02165.1 P-loop containing nucleoside triphosphate hydrolase protein [Laetiporus sulphureus 93-53]